MEAQPRWFRVYDNTTKGLLAETQTSKHLPDEWKLKKPVGAKKSPKKPMAFVYTTEECITQKSRWILDWDKDAKIGDVFWLKTGQMLCVEESVNVDDEEFTKLFKGTKNRIDSAQRFLELDQDCQERFRQLGVDRMIGFLKVPVRMHAQFRDSRFGLQQLVKYCVYEAETKERKAKLEAERECQEREEREREREIERKKIAAERYDTFGELNVRDDWAGSTATLKYEVRREDGFDSIIDIFHAEQYGIVPAAKKLQRKVRLPIEAKYNGNDQRKDFNLLLKMLEAWRKGILNPDVLEKIMGYYEWRFDHQVVPMELN